MSEAQLCWRCGMPAIRQYKIRVAYDFAGDERYEHNGYPNCIAALRSEIKRLRAALKRIVDSDFDALGDELRQIAEEVLRNDQRRNPP